MDNFIKNNSKNITHIKNKEYNVELAKINYCYFVTTPARHIVYDSSKKIFSPYILNRTNIKITSQKINSRITFKNIFLWTDHYGDKNICHWFHEQLVNIVFLYDLYKRIPDIKIIVNKDARILRNIKDVLYFIPNFKKESIYEFDFTDQVIEARSLYLGLGNFNSNNAPCKVYDFFLNVCKYKIVTPPIIYEKIYLSRRNTNTNTRVLQNMEEISNYIIEKGYKEFFLEDLSIQEKISILHFSKSIIMELGAGCINLCFCRPNTELFLLLQDNSFNIGFKSSFTEILKKLKVTDIKGQTVSNKNNGNTINTPWKLDLSLLKL